MPILAQNRTSKNAFRQLLSIAILIGWLNAIEENVSGEEPPTPTVDPAELQGVIEQAEKTAPTPIPAQ